MKTLQSLLFSILLAFVAPSFAQTAQPGGVVAPDVPEITSAPGAKAGCEKCKQGGMGRMAPGDTGGMQHGRMDGMACCKQGGMGGMAHGDMNDMDGMHHGGRGAGGGGSNELERRVAELEKRLDLMQQLPAQPHTR